MHVLQLVCVGRVAAFVRFRSGALCLEERKVLPSAFYTTPLAVPQVCLCLCFFGTIQATPSLYFECCTSLHMYFNYANLGSLPPSYGFKRITPFTNISKSIGPRWRTGGMLTAPMFQASSWTACGGRSRLYYVGEKTRTDHVVPDSDRGLEENGFTSIDKLLTSMVSVHGLAPADFDVESIRATTSSGMFPLDGPAEEGSGRDARDKDDK